MSYSSPNLLTDESRWLAKIARTQAMMVHQLKVSTGIESVTFTIGDGGVDTPENGSSQYINPQVLSVNTQVFLNGTGYLTKDVDYSVLPTGGIQLLMSTFTTAQTYVILY